MSPHLYLCSLACREREVTLKSQVHWRAISLSPFFWRRTQSIIHRWSHRLGFALRPRGEKFTFLGPAVSLGWQFSATIAATILQLSFHHTFLGVDTFNLTNIRVANGHLQLFARSQILEANAMQFSCCKNQMPFYECNLHDWKSTYYYLHLRRLIYSTPARPPPPFSIPPPPPLRPPPMPQMPWPPMSQKMYK